MSLKNAAAYLKRFVSGPTSASVAKSALPGAGINALLGLVTGGPGAALTYAAGDFLTNYPLMRLARRAKPGVMQQVKNLKTGEVTKGFAPSALETAANFGGSIISPYITDLVTGGGFTQKQTSAQPDEQLAIAQQQSQVTPQQLSQQQQTYQQLIQQDMINQRIGARPLSPGTMYQLPFHYPGVTLPPELLEDIEDMVQI